jgi:GNAT superfamily N-acetyltransferase
MRGRCDPVLHARVDEDSTVQIERLRSGRGRDKTKLAAIYEEAIPASERKPLAALLSDPAARITVARRAREPVGFAIVRLGKRADLLEYMAVRAGLRGAGIGAQLYRAARGDRAHDIPLLIEVDSTREASPDRAIRKRRIDFYRRLGGRQIIGLAYVLPLPSPTGPPAMDLLVDDWPDATVKRATLHAWLQELYGGVYGQPTDDERILAMLAPLGSEAVLA